MPPTPPKPLRWAIYALTMLGWVVLTSRALVPGVDHLVTDEQSRLALLVASVGTLKWLVRRMMHPAHELFLAGKMVGRAEALAETDESVIRLDERREQQHLRVVRDRATSE